MTVNAITPAGFTPYVPPVATDPTTTQAVGGTGSTSGVSSTGDFGHLVLDGLNRLEGLNQQSDSLALQASTGNLQSIHDYTIAATQTSVATQLSVAVRNKAIDAFNSIMQMQV